MCLQIMYIIFDIYAQSFCLVCKKEKIDIASSILWN